MKKPHGIHHALATGLSLFALGLTAPAFADEAPAPAVEPETVVTVDTPPEIQAEQGPVTDAPEAVVTDVPDVNPTDPEVIVDNAPTVVEDTPDLGRPGVTGVDESFVEKTVTDYNPEIAYNMPPVGVEATPEVALPVVDAEAASAAISAISAGQQLEVSNADSVSTDGLASPATVEAKLEGTVDSGAAPTIRNGHLISN